METGDLNNQFRQQSLEKLLGKDYIKDEPYNNAYKAWSLKQPGSPKGIGDDNVSTIDYTLVGLGIPKKEVPELERKVVTKINGAFLSITNNSDLAKQIISEGLNPKRVQIRELIKAGLLKASEDTYTKVEQGEEIFPGTAVVNPTFKWTDKTSGVEDFTVEKGSLGVGTAFNDEGGIDFSLKIAGKGADQYTILYPTSEVGDYNINEAINENYKVLKFKHILAKGANGGSYNIADGIDVISNINGKQFIHIADDSKSSGVRQISLDDQKQIEVIARNLFK
jgi:hypothetical protein